jgi:hypothetical protein
MCLFVFFTCYQMGKNWALEVGKIKAGQFGGNAPSKISKL